jgi:hypothetical protein
MTMRPQEQSYWDGRGLVLLWLGMGAGPTAWALNQLAGYALVKPACRANAVGTLVILAVVALLVTVGGAAVAWSQAMKLRHADLTGERTEDRSLMLAVSGIALNALLALLIITSASAPAFLGPCE